MMWYNTIRKRAKADEVGESRNKKARQERNGIRKGRGRDKLKAHRRPQSKNKKENKTMEIRFNIEGEVFTGEVLKTEGDAIKVREAISGVDFWIPQWWVLSKWKHLFSSTSKASQTLAR